MSGTEQTLRELSPVRGAGGEQRFGPYRSNTGHMFWVQYAGGKTRSIWVHREVLEKKLGRKLLRSEIVHHINHDKTDNRVENLEVMARGDHVRHHQTKNHPRMVEVPCHRCGIMLQRTRRHITRPDGRGSTPTCSGCRRAAR